MRGGVCGGGGDGGSGVDGAVGCGYGIGVCGGCSSGKRGMHEVGFGGVGRTAV